MGAATTTTTTTQAETPRPMFLSADKRKISYRSKNGNLVTLELKNSNAAQSLQDIAKTSAAETARNQKNTHNDYTGIWAGLSDTLSFWIMEGVEIAMFGAYDEPPSK